MNSAEQKGLDLSIQAYRRLLRMYPKGFLAQFGEQLEQTFGDLARRAAESGGTTRLILLWMRMLPDLLASAVGEHMGFGQKLQIAGARRRWILACVCGFTLGEVLSHGLWPGGGRLASLLMFLVVGFFQSWALRCSAGTGWRWMGATAAGAFVLAMPFRYFANGFPPNRLSLAGEMVFMVLSGAGIGLLQYLFLRKTSARAWLWIAANAVGAISAGVFAAGVASTFLRPALPYMASGFMTDLLMGAVFGFLTSIPFEFMLGPEESRDTTRA